MQEKNKFMYPIQNIALATRVEQVLVLSLFYILIAVFGDWRIKLVKLWLIRLSKLKRGELN